MLSSKYLAQDEESEQIVDDSAFDDSEASESTEDADETEKKIPTRNSPHRLRNLPPAEQAWRACCPGGRTRAGR